MSIEIEDRISRFHAPAPGVIVLAPNADDETQAGDPKLSFIWRHLPSGITLQQARGSQEFYMAKKVAKRLDYTAHIVPTPEFLERVEAGL